MVVGQSWLWGRACIGSGLHGCACMGPGLVLRVGLVVDGDRSGCAWGQGWVVGVGLVVHGVRASM